MVVMQIKLSDKATFVVRVFKAKYDLTNDEAVNKILEDNGVEL